MFIGYLDVFLCKRKKSWKLLVLAQGHGTKVMAPSQYVQKTSAIDDVKMLSLERMFPHDLDDKT